MLEHEQKHISTHIEKTAGSSIVKFLFDFYGRRNVMIYSADTDSLYNADNLVMLLRFSPHMDKFRNSKVGRELSPLINGAAINVLRFESQLNNHTKENILSENIAAIHGHFSADRFDTLIKNTFKTVILREPLQRAASHYRYWKTARGVLNERINIPYQNNMRFEEFALLDSMQNYQSKALGTTKIEEFDIVGIAESLESFISKFVQMRGQIKNNKHSNLMHLNASTEYRSCDDESNLNFVKKFKSLNELDYEIWNKAKLLNNAA